MGAGILRGFSIKLRNLTYVLAHRGASAVAPENTLRAFALARALGADGVELDVRMLGDGTVLVHHDPLLPDGRVIAVMAASSVPSHIPSLGEALAECAGLVVNVELKNDPAEPGYDPTGRLAAAVARVIRRGGAGDATIVSSFSEPTLAALGVEAPDLERAWLTGHRPRSWTRRCEQLARAGFGGVHPHHRLVDESMVRTAASFGLEVRVWTVDDPRRLAELAAMGVAAVITNVVDVAVNAVRHRS